MRKNLLLLFLLIPACCLAQSKTVAGDYKGYIDIPAQKLNVVVHIVEDARKLSGTIDIPDQNAMGLKLTEVKFNKGEVTYLIPDVPGNCSFKGTWKPETDSLNGAFTQSGTSLPMLTKKMNEDEVQKKKEITQAKIKMLESYADSLLKKSDIAGMSIGIYKDGEILINRGFGYKDLENKVKADENTLYAIGSCSKAFTTALLATLNDEGIFEWNTPVKTYIPYFGMKDKFADEQATAVDLCTHRTGLPRHDLVWYGATLTRKQLVERVKFMEPNEPFRSAWQYNNFMLMTAGVIAEEITKDTWENQVQKRLFDPIGMKKTKIHYDDFVATENKSKGYDVTDHKIVLKPYRNIDPMGPAGSIYSCSSDMLEWTKLLLNKGKVNDKVVITEAQVEFLLAPKMLLPGSQKQFKMLSYAMGWMVGMYKGKTVISHGGNIDGFTAYVALFPEDNMSVVVLTNKDGTGIPELFSIYANDRFNDREEYDWYEETIGKNKKEAALKEAEAKKAEEDEKKKNAKNKSTKPEAKKGPSHDLKNYCGEYYNSAYGTCKVELVNKELVATINTFELKMKHDQYETFLGSFMEDKMKINFFTNDGGKVEWLQIPLETSVEATKFVRKTPDYLNNAAYLEKICGDYDFQGVVMTVYMDGKKLQSKLSDGQHFELEPNAENLFKLKGAEGFKMEFVFDEKGNCIKVISHQPNGDYDAKRKK